MSVEEDSKEAEAEELQDQHAIAVAKETIPLSHRFLVGAQDKFAIGKGAYQHEQGRTREVEIGQEQIDPPDLLRWMKEDAGAAFLREQLAVCTSRRFQDTNRRRPDRDSPPGRVDCRCRRG